MGGAYNPFNLGLYTYTHFNPVRYTDPDGKFTLVEVGVAAIITVVVLVAIVNSNPQKHRAGSRNDDGLGGASSGTSGSGSLLGKIKNFILNENSEGQAEGSSDGKRNVGNIEIPSDATPADARGILTGAGSPSNGNTQDDPNGTGESGTHHEVDINGTKVDVRVMDGKGGSGSAGPRISVGNAKNPGQMVDRTTGKNFPNNVPKAERIDKSHIPLKSPE